MKTVQKKGFLLFLVLFHIGFIKAQELAEVVGLVTPRTESKINVTIQTDALAEAIIDNNEEVHRIENITTGRTADSIQESYRSIHFYIPVHIGMMIIDNQIFYNVECSLSLSIAGDYGRGFLGRCKHGELTFTKHLVSAIDIRNSTSMVHASFKEDFRGRTVLVRKEAKEEESIQIVSFVTPQTESKVNVIIQKDALRKTITEKNEEISITSKITIAPQPSQIDEYRTATVFSIPVNIEAVVVDGDVFHNIECRLYASIGSHHAHGHVGQCEHEDLKFTRSLLPSMNVGKEDNLVHVSIEPEEDLRNRTIIIRRQTGDAQ